MASIANILVVSNGIPVFFKGIKVKQLRCIKRNQCHYIFLLLLLDNRRFRRRFIKYAFVKATSKLISPIN
jgi:hypothetical protein